MSKKGSVAALLQIEASSEAGEVAEAAIVPVGASSLASGATAGEGEPSARVKASPSGTEPPRPAMASGTAAGVAEPST